MFNHKTNFPLPPGSQLKLNKEPGRKKDGEKDFKRREKESGERRPQQQWKGREQWRGSETDDRNKEVEMQQ